MADVSAIHAAIGGLLQVSRITSRSLIDRNLVRGELAGLVLWIGGKGRLHDEERKSIENVTQPNERPSRVCKRRIDRAAVSRPRLG